MRDPVSIDRAIRPIAKTGIYRRDGVPHVWLVNPIARTPEVLELRGEHYAILAVHQAADRVHAAPFEAFELDLALLWADVDWG